MRIDANKIALRAARNVLAPVRPFELQIAGTSVTCVTTAGAQPPWPRIEGFRETEDGPWPTPVIVDARWEGGRASLLVDCWYWQTSGRYRHLVGFRVRIRERPQELVWITLPTLIGDAEDEAVVQIRGNISSVKRKKDGSRTSSERMNETLKGLLQASGLPLASAAMAEVGKIKIPGAEIEPSPETALHRLVHLALLKLDFLDRGERARARGRALIDVEKLLGSDVALPSAEEDDEEGPDEDDNERSAEPGRRYWAGGFLWSGTSQLQAFLEGRYWQLGFSREAPEAAARTAWTRFEKIRAGDWFAIKGYGGTHDLKVHFVGEVKEVHPQTGRVDLVELPGTPRIQGDAPRGPGAGSFRDALVPVQRPDVIERIFGVADAVEEPPLSLDLPANLVFYGPPGTGKTFHLTKLQARFTRRVREVTQFDRAAELARELTWFECLALALKDLGGRAKVDSLLTHPLVKAKHAMAPQAALRQVVWGTLGHHTVESSTVVKMKRRFGELIFDKDADSTWILAEALPEDLNESLARYQAKTGGVDSRDFTFITFHQAYAYEDFIEGIRPDLAGAEGDEERQIAYRLEDGMFKQAVRAAVRLTGFEGTLHEFCTLDPVERRRLLETAPRYAVFIDEINRGNVARVFGELITLLEPDKRLGAEHEMIVQLPYSRTRFGVPSNLNLIGTMNTADRSVEALDTALRRRFEFKELAPDPSLLNFAVADQVHVGNMLKTMNRRIEKLCDADHAIGHAYFLPLEDDPTLENLQRVFETSVLPLLREYFYGDWGKIGLVLGRDFVVRRDAGTTKLADFDHDDREMLGERATYELAPISALTTASFRRIYEDVPSD
jgi:hypothetical protein